MQRQRTTPICYAISSCCAPIVGLWDFWGNFLRICIWKLLPWQKFVFLAAASKKSWMSKSRDSPWTHRTGKQISSCLDLSDRAVITGHRLKQKQTKCSLWYTGKKKGFTELIFRNGSADGRPCELGNCQLNAKHVWLVNWQKNYAEAPVWPL